MRAWIGKHRQLLAWLLIVAICGVNFWRLEHEGKIRRDQTCVTFERDWYEDISGLEATYEFLTDPREQNNTLVPAILRNLPRSEQAVLNSQPPAYCKPTDVGESREWPEHLERPAHVDALYRALPKD